MNKEQIYPKLRQLDVIPTEISGQKVFALRDPLNLSGKILFFPYQAFFIISLFDGQHSITDVQVEFMRRFGELIYREKIYELIEQLEQHYLLESERFWNAQNRIMADFKKAALRPMALIGEAYADDREEVKNMVNSFFHPPAGPGLPQVSFPSKNLIGVIAPHIDYRRGGHCYAFAHKAILESEAADLYIILGIAHAATQNPYVLTRKDFETPWGVVETDRSFISELEAKLAFDPYEDEFAHKTEHSIELQLIFLKSLWPHQSSFKIVPILCGSFHEAVLEGKSPQEMESIKNFLDSLKTVISAPGSRKICLLASADLAHLGLRFGDAEEPNRFSLQTLQEDDLHLLKFVEQVDAEGFYQVIRQERDRRRICGLPAIYTLLYLLQNRTRQGNLLKYSQAFDAATKSVVTFASAAFYS
ncbi:MAG: AmmeMemoRadiSam system protein B [Thermodesulfobacteriota bacterium]